MTVTLFIHLQILCTFDASPAAPPILAPKSNITPRQLSSHMQCPPSGLLKNGVCRIRPPSDHPFISPSSVTDQS